MKNTDRNQGKAPIPADVGAERTGAAAEEKRVAARRRFLKMGAGGSTAVVVTVAHRRAFAGMKKGQVISNCVSLQGVPDLKGMDQKKALQMSVGGTPKGVVCTPRPATNQCVANKESQYYNEQGLKVLVASAKFMKSGCGNLADTLHYQADFRLYEKGYCPVIVTPSGDLTYDTSAVYYDKDGCKVGEVSKDGSKCVQIGTNNKGDPVTFWERKCEGP